MKKQVLLYFVMLLGFASHNKAQQILPDGNFESWSRYTPVPPAHPFDQPTGGFFYTLNILDTIPTPPGITVYKCDTAHTGSYSARCITRKIDVLSILIPGVVGTLKLNWINNSAILGLPYKWTNKPLRFQGYYQSYPVKNDASAVVLLLSKWNAVSKKRDTIAYNKLVFNGTVSAWTKFDTAVIYRNPNVMPDTICMLLLSCAGFNASNLFGSTGEVGSQALFDDITLTGLFPYAVEDLMAQDINISVSPNPATDYLQVKLEKAVKDATFEVYNTQGCLVLSHPMQDMTGRFSVSSLSAGMYFYHLRTAGNTLGSGKFVINR